MEIAERELLQAEEEHRVLQKQLHRAEAAMEGDMNEWSKAVDVIIEKLDKSFKEYMTNLQFNGRVYLRKVGLIDEYEVVMQVCFRQGGELADLSGQRHSGGERAVSTIMYLMALQELTSSPFRVVDEINQGMDERNER
jgi:chromosome segregation ATPase